MPMANKLDIHPAERQLSNLSREVTKVWLFNVAATLLLTNQARQQLASRREVACACA